MEESPAGDLRNPVESHTKETRLIFSHSKGNWRAFCFVFCFSIREINLSNQCLRKCLLATGTAVAQVPDGLSAVMVWAPDGTGMQE